jgi:ribosomal protein S18 acetylase RimI-like enzyme
MNTNIRSMTESDIKAVSEIVSDGYTYLAKQEGFSPKQLDRLLTERSSKIAISGWLAQWQCYVAELRGSVIGALAIKQNEIEEIWVHPQHHSHGVGTAMFQKAEHLIAKAGYTELILCCAAVSARPFYKAMGAEIVYQKPCSCGPLIGWTLTYYWKKLNTTSVVQ